MNFMNTAQLQEVNAIVAELESLVGIESMDLTTVPSLGEQDKEKIWELIPADIYGVITATGILVHFLAEGRRGVFPGNLSDGRPFVIIPVDLFDSMIDVRQIKTEIEQIASGRLRLKGLVAYWDNVAYDLHDGIELVKEAVATGNGCKMVEYSISHPWLLEVYGPLLHEIYTAHLDNAFCWDDVNAQVKEKDRCLPIFREAAALYDGMVKTNRYFCQPIERQLIKFANE